MPFCAITTKEAVEKIAYFNYLSELLSKGCVSTLPDFNYKIREARPDGFFELSYTKVNLFVIDRFFIQGKTAVGSIRGTTTYIRKVGIGTQIKDSGGETLVDKRFDATLELCYGDSSKEFLPNNSKIMFNVCMKNFSTNQIVSELKYIIGTKNKDNIFDTDVFNRLKTTLDKIQQTLLSQQS